MATKIAGIGLTARYAIVSDADRREAAFKLVDSRPRAVVSTLVLSQTSTGQQIGGVVGPRAGIREESNVESGAINRTTLTRCLVVELLEEICDRSAHGLEVQSGLVETDWYSSPVNLVLRKSAGLASVHLGAGDLVALAILIPRHLRRPALEVAQSHARLSRETRKGLAEWDTQHARDRSVYKSLARSRHGRV